MLTFLQNPVKPLSHNLSKTLSPPSSYPLFSSIPVTTISTKCLCQPKTSFPTLATSSSSQSHSTAGSNPNSKSHKSVQNPKKKTKSVINCDDKVMDLAGTNNGNHTISENDQSDSGRQAPYPSEQIPRIKPQKPRRGRPSKAQTTKNLIYSQFEQTLASIRAENPEQILKESPKNPNSDSYCDEDSDEESELDDRAKKESVEEEDPEWPLDAEVGWGIRASDFFEKYPIKNVVDNGMEIDWEGELDEGWVKEINCLEWESFAFHPSPLVLLVFQRYERAADNWTFLKELEKAAKVYWSCKDRLPPRTVKIDVNIETDLAYALKVKESDCPQLLFLRGNQLLYREKEIRCADELVKMIAHFYYNAKRPEWVDSSIVPS